MRPASFQSGATALILACVGGHVEVVKALLDAKPKADIEAKMNVGVLSMHL
jgi:ankyrin repeat protein